MLALDLRSELPADDWSRLSLTVRSNAGFRCEKCDAREAKGKPLHCHEVWLYDDDQYIQSLDCLISVCRECHNVIHFERSRAKGNVEVAFARLKVINGWSNEKAAEHVGQARAQWKVRSQHSWLLDASKLLDYGVDPPPSRRPGERT